ncbi:hypothetical protein HPB50_024133 [Hyalomma asiaticum]|uniref:Uncharacterized protein n=1 Tax=Hyalomma asiaticum TaxID=266040 RepID=A0ACB7SI61_HYAAI|nr:hypothetical protein HPB50_024133 [Hyalomma asiaticum]
MSPLGDEVPAVLMSVVVKQKVWFSQWVPEITHHCQKTPFLLVGTQIDLRDDAATLEKLAKNKQKPISNEQGEKLAKELKAVKYVECSALTQRVSERNCVHSRTKESTKCVSPSAATLVAGCTSGSLACSPRRSLVLQVSRITMDGVHSRRGDEMQDYLPTQQHCCRVATKFLFGDPTPSPHSQRQGFLLPPLPFRCGSPHRSAVHTSAACSRALPRPCLTVRPRTPLRASSGSFLLDNELFQHLHSFGSWAFLVPFLRWRPNYSKSAQW